LSFSLKLIKAENIEKKLFGLRELNDLIDSLKSSTELKTIFVEKIQSRKLIEYILEESFHVELLKRS